ncbi:hypothetical protein NUU61_003554 [Penicillium alfredii]|uniref:Uncharacterized protein n=1 Tax=Penicillium alfredii TaxID=1506179 RepID=A0A9W9FK03_9EURO|nr:uncharacterized protein NUU61_003554 [Penicillium alfredii]KAJ5101332.1 hypothetical protein NUU61_003554 [Penicillium alfredii]
MFSRKSVAILLLPLLQGSIAGLIPRAETSGANGKTPNIAFFREDVIVPVGQKAVVEFERMPTVGANVPASIYSLSTTVTVPAGYTAVIRTVADSAATNSGAPKPPPAARTSASAVNSNSAWGGSVPVASSSYNPQGSNTGAPKLNTGSTNKTPTFSPNTSTAKINRPQQSSQSSESSAQSKTPSRGSNQTPTITKPRGSITPTPTHTQTEWPCEVFGGEYCQCSYTDKLGQKHYTTMPLPSDAQCTKWSKYPGPTSHTAEHTPTPVIISDYTSSNTNGFEGVWQSATLKYMGVDNGAGTQLHETETIPVGTPTKIISTATPTAHCAYWRYSGPSGDASCTSQEGTFLGVVWGIEHWDVDPKDLQRMMSLAGFNVQRNTDRWGTVASIDLGSDMHSLPQKIKNANGPALKCTQPPQDGPDKCPQGRPHPAGEMNWLHNTFPKFNIGAYPLVPW